MKTRLAGSLPDVLSKKLQFSLLQMAGTSNKHVFSFCDSEKPSNSSKKNGQISCFIIRQTCKYFILFICSLYIKYLLTV